MRRTCGIAALVAGALLLPATASAGTLSGTVWSDADGDGRRERAEALLRGIAVEVQRAPRAGRPYARAARRTTNASGRWSFTVRRSGRYRVRLTLPPGARLTARDRDRRDRVDSDLSLVRGAALSAARRLTRRSRSVRLDAGIVLARVAVPPPPPGPPTLPVAGGSGGGPAGPGGPPAVGDRVWRDDGDGVQEAGEPGEPGVEVEVWTADRTTRLATATTGAGGQWSLGVPAGVPVRVRVLLPAGAIVAPALAGGDRGADSDVAPAGPASGFSDPITTTGPRTDVDVGLAFPPPVAVGNRVWSDADGDTVLDASETSTLGIGGLTVELWNDGVTQRLASTTTAADGVYALSAPRGGTYRVRFVLPDGGWRFTFRPGAGNPLVDGDSDAAAPPGPGFGVTASFTPTANLTSIDAGIVRPITIGNLVWLDTNQDGIRDTDEPGASGVRVRLWDGGRTALLDEATTNTSGDYTVRAPGAGTYRLEFEAPFGRTFTLKDQGGNDLSDSDVWPAPSPDAGFTDAFPLASNVISNTTWDAGLRPG